MRRARLYVIPLSNAAAAGAAMVAHKRIPHRVVSLMPGLHPPLVRFAGFEGHTVPALALNGHMVQGTRRISRFLDGIEPEPPLFPVDPARRREVEEAERWGEQVLQPVPRRLFRHILVASEAARVWFAAEIVRVPAPAAMATLFMPVIRTLAAKSRADGERVREDLARLPELLDHADALIATGTIGGGAPSAADFQILASVRILLEFEDLGHLLEGRSCVPAARRLYPRWAGPIPRTLPPAAGAPAG
jgi:glutathione S-transferase